MKNNILTLIMICCSIVSIGQKYDNVWLGGLNEYPGEAGNGNYIIRFDSGQPVVDSVNAKTNFESTVSTLCDSLGNLKFYSNGCDFYRYYLSTSTDPGGYFLKEIDNPIDKLNEGWIRDSTCSRNGYISPQGMMMLHLYQPNPALKDRVVFGLNLGMHYDQKWGLVYGPLYSTYITPLQVITVNPFPILPLVLAPVAQNRRYEPFAVVRHGNGADYWVIVPEYSRNRYNLIRIGSTGEEEFKKQEIGAAMHCHIGSTVFSPDGSKFARVQNCGVTVMDFDRCTGVLSNPIYLSRPTHTFGGGGAVFSPDGKKLLVSSQLAILKADLDLPNPVLDTLIPTSQILGNSLGLMQEGPDGNIYFSSLQRSRQMPVLKDPWGNSPVFYLLDLPVNSVRSLPHFPNFRLHDWPNSPCDTLGINAPVDTKEPSRIANKINLSPNPANDFVEIKWDFPENLHPEWIQIWSIEGKLIQKIMIYPDSRQSTTVDISNLKNGFYLISIVSNHQLYTKKLVVIH